MRIEASQISFQTVHQSTSSTTVVDRTRDTVPKPAPAALPVAADTVRLSGQASVWNGNRQDLSDLDPKQRLAVLVVEALLGQKVNLLRVRSNGTGQAGTPAPAPAAAQPVHQRTEYHSEAERTSFQAQGTVQTADGRTISFSAELLIERASQSQSTTTRQQATDPLVVNFGGGPARVTGAKFNFDLNADGTSESISFVAGGSGFLVLDRNGDGKVNDGSELFGPQSGNGFADLAAYDADGNGWIDENDPVFARLQIWTKDSQGNDVLSSLAAKGIGAISTASADTPFAVKDASNVQQAEIRSSGVYLLDNGAAGTIQQMDLVAR